MADLKYTHPSSLPQGQPVSEIWWGENNMLRVTHADIELMEIRNQNGQMAEVPYVYVLWKDGRHTLYNVAMAEGVTMPPREEDEG